MHEFVLCAVKRMVFMSIIPLLGGGLAVDVCVLAVLSGEYP